MQHTFYVHFFAVVLPDYNVKLPETSDTFFLEEMWDVFTAAHFRLGGFKHFSCSQGRYRIFMFFFQQNWSLLFFFSLSVSVSVSLSLCVSFSVIHVNVHIKIKSKKLIGFFVVVVIS